MTLASLFDRIFVSRIAEVFSGGKGRIPTILLELAREKERVRDRVSERQSQRRQKTRERA
jgi:hypothetical protein